MNASNESRERAAQAWCMPTTKHLDMIPQLAEEFAKILDDYKRQSDGWLELAREFSRSIEYLYCDFIVIYNSKSSTLVVYQSCY